MTNTYDDLVHTPGGLEKAVEEKKRKPILCLDFDGVCHSYDSGWKGPCFITDPPVPLLFEFLNHALDHFEVHVFSSRSHSPGAIDAMRSWFTAHEHHWWKGQHEAASMYSITEKLHFPREKPPAFVSIDDRAIQFKGIFPNVHDLLDFKPWNKQ